MRSRIRCRTTNAACPSFRWKTAGSEPSAFSARTPPMPEDDFLLDARFAIAAVEPRRELAIPRRVLLEIRVEQVQLHPAETDAPDRHEHGAVAERHRGDARLAVGRDRRLDRRIRPVEPLVAFLLPAFGGHVLMEVALRVHEADADQRHAEVARLPCSDRQRGRRGRRRRSAATGAGRTRPRSTRSSGARSAESASPTRCCRPPRAASSAAIARSYSARNSGSLRGRLELWRGITHSMRTGLCAVARQSV